MCLVASELNTRALSDTRCLSPGVGASLGAPPTPVLCLCVDAASCPCCFLTCERPQRPGFWAWSWVNVGTGSVSLSGLFCTIMKIISWGKCASPKFPFQL